MNSDPYDSAAWRTFGMLDADESAIFDEAMRHDPLLQDAYLEMNRLSAAIAASTCVPVQPKAGQLERLQSRLALTATKRAYIWLGISGWAAAAVLALLLVIKRSETATHASSTAASPAGTTMPEKHAAIPSAKPTQDESMKGTLNPDMANATKTNTQENPGGASEAIPVENDSSSKAVAKVETKRLVQEIEVLRENLEKYQRRDRVLFEPVPGMALPVVMTMKAPSSYSNDATALAKNDEHSPITVMLGDAVKTMNTLASVSKASDNTQASSATVAPSQINGPAAALVDNQASRLAILNAMGTINQSAAALQPSALPIYDAARDSGTLVVNNLPKVLAGEAYNLWVTTEPGTQPIYVGSLPEGGATGADSFDFSLGSTTILPSSFLLTKDPKDKPSLPTTTNTVLQGPPPTR